MPKYCYNTIIVIVEIYRKLLKQVLEKKKWNKKLFEISTEKTIFYISDKRTEEKKIDTKIVYFIHKSLPLSINWLEKIFSKSIEIHLVPDSIYNFRNCSS